MYKELIMTNNEYQKLLEQCKEYRKKYKLIDNGKEIIENFNANLIPNFNSYKNPYINVVLKFMKLITDLDIVNQNIIESHEIWQKIRKSEQPNYTIMLFNTYLYKRLNKLHEYIIFDLKHFTDEMISTVSIIKGFLIDNNVYISSVGEYLKKNEKNFNDFDQFLDLFDKLNNLSNAYKHSYANSEFSAIGRDENCFVALYSKFNNFDNQPVPYVISVNYIVEEFNKFYKFSFELIDNLTKDK